MIVAGFPAYIEFGGTSLVTTDPAPIIEFFPIFTPGRITEFTPMKTLFSIIVMLRGFLLG